MSDKMRWRYGDTNPVMAAVETRNDAIRTEAIRSDLKRIDLTRNETFLPLSSEVNNASSDHQD